MPTANLQSRIRFAMANQAAGEELLNILDLGFTFGTVRYVDADSGSNGNTGLSSDQAFKTVAKCESVMTSNANDVCLMTGNAPHAIADQLTMTKNRMHFIGLGGSHRYIGQRTRWEMGVTSGSAIALCKNTGNGNTFTNIKMRSIDTLSTSLYTFADGGEHTRLESVALEKATDLGTALAAELLANGDTCYYLNCAIGNLIYERSDAARACVLFKREVITGKVCRDTIFEGGYVLNKAGVTTSVHFHLPGATDIERMLVFDNVKIISAKTGSATQARAFNIDASQTVGEIYLVGGTSVHNVTEIADTGEGVFTDHPAAVKDGPESIGVAVT